MEHTPWTYHTGEGYITIYNSRGDEVLTTPCFPDVDAPLLASIVQAVNSHDELVAALNLLMSARQKDGTITPSQFTISVVKNAISNATKEGK